MIAGKRHNNYMDYKFGSLFSKKQSTEDNRAKEAMNEEIQKVGGLLHFTIQKDENGWHAECDEIEGLMTGGTSTHPSDEEIQTNIREAIHTAFHIPAADKVEKPILNANQFQAIYSFAPKNGFVPA